jgi:hypothetical protein
MFAPLFAVVFLGHRRKFERQRLGAGHFKLSAAVGAGDNLATHDVVQGDLGFTFRTGGTHFDLSSSYLNEQQKTLPVQYAWKGVLCKSEAQNNLPGQGDFLLLFFAKMVSKIIGDKVSTLRHCRQPRI